MVPVSSVSPVNDYHSCFRLDSISMERLTRTSANTVISPDGVAFLVKQEETAAPEQSQVSFFSFSFMGLNNLFQAFQVPAQVRGVVPLAPPRDFELPMVG